MTVKNLTDTEFRFMTNHENLRRWAVTPICTRCVLPQQPQTPLKINESGIKILIPALRMLELVPHDILKVTTLVLTFIVKLNFIFISIN